MQKTVAPTDVAVFLAVLEQRSFSLAARNLGISIATASRRVASLEERIGVQLLARTTRQLAATPEGVDYARRARRALDDLDEAEVEARGAAETPRGLLRVAAPPELAHLVLGAPIEALLRTWPELAVEVNLSHRNVDLVAEGYDLALRFNVAPDSTLVGRKLGVIALMAMASPAYLARRPAPATPGALRGHDILALSADSYRRRVTFRSGRARRVTVDLAARFFANSFEVLREMAIRGAGIALLPELMTTAEVAHGELAAILPRWSVAGATLYAVVARRRLLPARTRCLLAALHPLGSAVRPKVQAGTR